MSLVQWYPGHMTKAVRMMKESLRQVELVVELLDARVPLSSRNPDIAALCEGKQHLLVLNKSDLADESKTKEWVSFFKEQGVKTLPFCAKKAGGAEPVTAAIHTLMREKSVRNDTRGVKMEHRVMVCGIPNVGKSALINCLAGKAVTKTENRPGVTRGKQWISLGEGLKLLDTPGILWPKFEDQNAARKLAMIGSLNDNNLEPENLAFELAQLLETFYPGALGAFYGFDEAEVSSCAEAENTDPAGAVLYLIAKKRGCLKKGGIPDYGRASRILLTDFRNGRAGRFTLDNGADE